jgi:enterochelin esterase-like enzyme
MRRGLTAAMGAAGLLFVAAPAAGAASLEPHTDVLGADVVAASVRPSGGVWRTTAWDDLEQTPLAPGRYQVRFEAQGDRDGESVEVPYCSGRGRVAVDGRQLESAPGALVTPLAPGHHVVVIDVTVSDYERRIACGDRPRVGSAAATTDGVGVIRYPSPTTTKGGGRALVYVPPRHDPRAPRPLLVGLHPWNGSMWTYAAYARLLREAGARDVLLLMPSGLGNSLYTAEAEDEVMRAIDAVSEVLAVDGRSISVWGASMGGAGATTIGFHRPDRFATITSFFGDSHYDLSTYARSILPNERASHRVNALDIVDNARHVPVWLIHGEDDRTSPIRQSAVLAAKMQERGFPVRFDRVAGIGHSGALVTRFLSELVALAASARTPEHVTRVTYRSVRSADVGAYGLRITRESSMGDAFVDVEGGDDAVHVRRADGVRVLDLARGSMGTPERGPSPPIVIDDADARARGFVARWEP